jgi:hypothetical protein
MSKMDNCIPCKRETSMLERAQGKILQKDPVANALFTGVDP